MNGFPAARPKICLNMIVRNEAHIVGEVLDATAPYISSWVVVDTGSNDGTQDLIENHMSRLGIPGELHERPWRDFGHNRSEALTLAQGHGDYIWVMDADDTVVGTPDFTELNADIYLMRVGKAAARMYCWRAQLFRDGLPVRYEGVIHETAVCDQPCVTERLQGEYLIESRRLGARNADPQKKLASDLELLLGEVGRNPEDTRSILHLGQTYYDMGDFANARKWYARRAEMGGSPEEVYHALYQVASSMTQLGAPWPETQDILLQAWEVRPTRAEPLYVIAQQHRGNQRYRLGYLFARIAAEIPFPEGDTLMAPADVYTWRAAEEWAACASMIGKQTEAFALCRLLLSRPGIPEEDRRRIAANRDTLVPMMIDAVSAYPEALIQRLVAGQDDADVVVSVVAGPDRASTEQTLNSFLNCCLDVSRVGRFLVVDAGLSAEDRSLLRQRYGFLDVVPSAGGDQPGVRLGDIRAHVEARYWLHLDQGWRFFAPENLLTRLTAVLGAEADVCQVGINFTDAVGLTGACATDDAVRRAPDAGRYVLAARQANGPAMFDTERLDRSGSACAVDPDRLVTLGQGSSVAGFRYASLDEVLCLKAMASPTSAA